MGRNSLLGASACRTTPISGCRCYSDCIPAFGCQPVNTIQISIIEWFTAYNISSTYWLIVFFSLRERNYLKLYWSYSYYHLAKFQVTLPTAWPVRGSLSKTGAACGRSRVCRCALFKSQLTELDDGKFYRKTLYLMLKNMVSGKDFPLNHWHPLTSIDQRIKDLSKPWFSLKPPTNMSLKRWFSLKPLNKKTF